MSLPKVLGVFSILLFAGIGIAALSKSEKKPHEVPAVAIVQEKPIEIPIKTESLPVIEKSKPTVQNEIVVKEEKKAELKKVSANLPLPEANRIEQFFNKGPNKFPFVETITYKSHVPWKKEKKAWLADYAKHYATSLHFIARSLNGKADYQKLEIAEGDRFNILKKDKNIEFYLVIDTSRCKMWFYSFDKDSQERTLIKTYHVGLGRPDETKESGLLTPLGKYSLGNKVAIYRPKTMGIHNNQKTEMIKTFGTRWIPFDQEMGGNTAQAKGFGLHGVPWDLNDKGQLAEVTTSLGKYESDGCVRLSTADIEELYAIIITKPSYIELVRDFHEAKLPGTEKSLE
ncbi:L,D-transpeptidase catalytic domain [Candidatus Rubidus massiliensis]|nr:L,D-transpeptidase catalytic domain [Candidatus Rubidus massiliensis]